MMASVSRRITAFEELGGCPRASGARAFAHGAEVEEDELAFGAWTSMFPGWGSAW